MADKFEIDYPDDDLKYADLYFMLNHITEKIRSLIFPKG
jgi:hypothetical protein